jgi:capsular polysaccharide biosynthesis protein
VQIVNAVAKVFVDEIPKLMSVDNVSILNEAKLKDSPVPVKPNPKLNIAISIVVALMIGIGLAFLLEYLDDTVKTEQDVREILDLPTIAVIPKIKKKELDTIASKTMTKAGEIRHVTE